MRGQRAWDDVPAGFADEEEEGEEWAAAAAAACVGVVVLLVWKLGGGQGRVVR